MLYRLWKKYLKKMAVRMKCMKIKNEWTDLINKLEFRRDRARRPNN